MQRSGVGIGRAIDPHQYAAYSRGRTPATIYTNVPNLSLINTHTPLSPAPRRGLPTFRRPHTPLSSSPLREDFDEYTNTRPDRSTAVFDPPTVHSPVAEDFDAPTTTRPTTTMEQEEDEDVEAKLVGRRMVLPRPPRATQPPQPPPPIAGPSRGYGRGHTRNLSEGSPLPRPIRPNHPPSSFSPPARHKEVLDDYEDYDQFLDETDRVFRAGSYAQNSRATLTTSLSLALSRRRPASSSTRQEQQEPQTIDSQSISHSYIPERPSNPLLEGMGTTTVPTTKTDSQTNSGFGEVIQRSASLVDRRYSTFRRSPNSKTEFAMVDNTVVAQDAERTVEVSAWREQVAREAVDGNQRMSVYYVMQNDVLEVGRGAFREIKVDQMEEEEIVETYLDYHQPQSRPTAQRMRSFSTGSMDDFRPLRTSSPYPFKTTTQVRPRPTHGQGYDRARRRGAPPTPPRSQNNGTPRTGSSPLSLGYSSNSRRSKERGRMMSLEDVARQPSSPPDPKPGPFIESILADCEPSLTHLGPILAKLGITTEAHLLAVMKLRGETRDREVREEALRLGITIVEWAVFVDKLLSWF